MIEKYTIDLRQFNNGESGKITFPTFDQCLMYGLHKLKKSMESKTCIIQAILLEDTQGRKIIVTPSEDEMESMATHTLPSLKVKLNKDPDDGDARFTF
jgi:hypothetical protein